MSKRNNKKKGEQEITQNEVHAMAQEWQNSKDDERVLVLFSLSEFGRLRFYVRGPRWQFLSLLDKEITPTLNSLANEPLIDDPTPLRTKRMRRKNEHTAPHGGSASSIGSFRSTSRSKTTIQTIQIMLSTEEKELVKTSYESGQSAEDIAEIHDLDEIEVLDFIDDLEQSQQ